MKNTPILALLLLLTACGNGRQEARTGSDERSDSTPAQRVETSFSNDSSIQVQTDSTVEYAAAQFAVQPFSRIPSEVDGCSGLFSSDSAAFRSSRYLFAGDLQTIAFIQMDGKMVQLARKASKLAEDKIIEAYEGGGYRVELDVTKQQVLGEELWRYAGELRIIRGGEMQRVPVTGQVGC